MLATFETRDASEKLVSDILSFRVWRIPEFGAESQSTPLQVCLSFCSFEGSGAKPKPAPSPSIHQSPVEMISDSWVGHVHRGTARGATGGHRARNAWPPLPHQCLTRQRHGLLKSNLLKNEHSGRRGVQGSQKRMFVWLICLGGFKRPVTEVSR